MPMVPKMLLTMIARTGVALCDCRGVSFIDVDADAGNCGCGCVCIAAGSRCVEIESDVWATSIFVIEVGGETVREICEFDRLLGFGTVQIIRLVVFVPDSKDVLGRCRNVTMVSVLEIISLAWMSTMLLRLS